ncbi:MAG TPA: hypothetical protein PK390_02225 [Fervidobacterium nodosum]|nr:hypothetical protein [Fervidobacterium nodosum]
MRLINWVLNAPEDDLVLKQFVSSLNERLGKINVAKMYAGYEPVTFLDI